MEPEAGDHMITNFFRAAFAAWPAYHVKWDEKLPCQKKYYGDWWDKSNAEVVAAARSGELPVENLEQDFYLGSSRWGDSFDALLENCPPEALRQYPVAFLLGRVKLRGRVCAASSRTTSDKAGRWS